MDLELADKIVLISGAARGIGLGIARGFLTEDSRVVLTDINAGLLAETEILLKAEFAENRTLAFVGDMTDESDINRILKATGDSFGPVEVLIANIGFSSGRPGLESDSKDWLKFFEYNLFGAVKLTRAAHQQLRETKGRIIYIASIAGMEVLGAPVPYSAAKSALIATMRNFAKNLASEGIRVNSVSPGNVLFDDSIWDRKMKTDRESTVALIKRVCPMNRFATPTDIADAVLFLASARASFITGTNLVVDGGQVSGIAF